ncbi:transposase, partial [Ligilactobacillus salivarius]|nr:transposase [Ligilactobacillus salivarius]
YTSQTSFLDNEEPINQNGDKARKRKGLSPTKRRIKRGLFRSNKGFLINADVNGALQILRKVVPNAFADGIDGIG